MQLLTSLIKDSKKHRPVLDVIVGCDVASAAMPGHHVLQFDTELSWGQLQMLLAALHAAGLIAPDFLRASINDGFSTVRLA